MSVHDHTRFAFNTKQVCGRTNLNDTVKKQKKYGHSPNISFLPSTCPLIAALIAAHLTKRQLRLTESNVCAQTALVSSNAIQRQLLTQSVFFIYFLPLYWFVSLSPLTRDLRESSTFTTFLLEFKGDWILLKQTQQGTKPVSAFERGKKKKKEKNNKTEQL